MKHISKFFIIALLVLATVSCKNDTKNTEDAATANDTIAKTEKHRIISLNGAVTEIIAALGHEGDIVGVDVTSTYPESVKNNAEDLGHVRSISIEALMALQPTLILATDKDISPELLEKIKASGIQAQVYNQEFTPEGTKKLIADVAKTLNNTSFKELQDKTDADLANVASLDKEAKVLFIYARGAGTLMVAGAKTPVDKVIELAGAKNAITEFEDFKPLTPEALIKGNPDVILMFDSGLGSLGGPQGVLKIQGVSQTNAGKNKRIIAMDGGLLSGFGPRVGEAALELNGKLAADAK